MDTPLIELRGVSKFFGTVIALREVTFDVKAGKWAAFETLNRLQLVDISNNLGDAKSLITHPATTTHQRLSPEMKETLGITPGLIRFSVGLEDAGDLVADIMQALDAV